MKNNSKINVTILSDIEYENLVAEILVDGKFIGLVTNEPDKNICFEIPNGALKFEVIDLEIFQDALTLAKKELIQE